MRRLPFRYQGLQCSQRKRLCSLPQRETPEITNKPKTVTEVRFSHSTHLAKPGNQIKSRHNGKVMTVRGDYDYGADGKGQDLRSLP